MVKPDVRRVRRNLSAIINFHKFREERLQNYSAFSERGVSWNGCARMLLYATLSRLIPHAFCVYYLRSASLR
jgi:hypothetical protein